MEPQKSSPNDPAPPTKKHLQGERGQSGTLIFKGIITGEEYNANLTGSRGYEIYDIMRRSDATVRAALQVCKLPILAAPWTINPASDDKQDILMADFVRNQLFGQDGTNEISFIDFLREAMSMLDFGHSVFEKVYMPTKFEGRTFIGLHKLGSRKQTSILKWEMSNGQPGIQQNLMSKPAVDIEMEKLIVFTHEKEGDNHEGISILRYAYKHWDIKDKLYLIDAIKLERQALGVVDIETPETNVDENVVDQLVEGARQLRANEEGYVRRPAGYKVGFMDMKANTTADVMPSVSHHDRQIVKSVLAQFLELGATGDSGSRALSEDHSKLFILSLEAIAKTIKMVIQNNLVKQLIDLNFSAVPNGYPTIEFGAIGDENIAVLAEGVQKLVTANALTPDAEMEEYLRTVLHLPGMPDEYKKDYENRPRGGTAPTPPQLIPGDPNAPQPPTPPKGKDTGDTDITASEAIEKARAYRNGLIVAVERLHAQPSN